LRPEPVESTHPAEDALPDGLKVLHVLDHSLPLHAGYSFRTASILHAQRKQGLEPVAVTSPKHEESWKKETTPVETIDGVRYYRTGAVAKSPVPLAYEMKLMGALERRIREVAAIERPDLIHARSGWDARWGFPWSTKYAPSGRTPRSTTAPIAPGRSATARCAVSRPGPAKAPTESSSSAMG
jgi:hypothetical protein